MALCEITIPVDWLRSAYFDSFLLPSGSLTEFDELFFALAGRKSEEMSQDWDGEA
jgi:hypothetical protein